MEGIMSKIIVVGAGIIGLSTCEKLLSDGHNVTLVDQNTPGSQTSFGNAGLIANYANQPLSNIDTIKSLPKLLLNKESGISLDKYYLYDIKRFGINFFRSAFPTRFQHNKKILGDILVRSVLSHQKMIERVSLGEVVTKRGCLHIFKKDNTDCYAVKKIVQNKQESGINCQYLLKEEIQSIEPDINLENVEAGILYPDTQILLDPEKHSTTIFNHIKNHPNFSFIQQDLVGFEEFQGAVHARLSDGELKADRIILCAGIYNNKLLKAHRIHLPIVSERGYHLTIEQSDIKLTRPVGWVGKYFFAVPMENTIRVAGTTEFARIEKEEDLSRYTQMKSWSEELLGRTLKETSRWMGVRHSSPDGIPVIGQLPKMKKTMVCYGHGHLGLTMAGFSADFISKEIEGTNDKHLSEALSADRFL